MSVRAAVEQRLRMMPGQKVRRGTKGGVEFRCPEHEDANPSAWLGDQAWKCLGCGAGGSLRDLAKVLGVPVEEGYTLDEYARSKGFDIGKLKDWGLETVNLNGQDVLQIPYYGEDGKLLRNRYRNEHGKRWWEGHNKPIHPYGLERLADIGEDGRLLLVEGESDCHAAWHEGVNALGIPGANCWKPEWARYVEGLDLYVWQEPDQGGESFVADIARTFPRVRIIRPATVKDLAALRARENGNLNGALGALLSAAQPANTRPCPTGIVVGTDHELDEIADELARPIDATPTLYPSWSRQCGGSGGNIGLARGWHVVVGGKSSSGKSLTAANIATKAIRSGEVATYLTLEMRHDEVVRRVLSIFAGLSVREISAGTRFNREVWEQGKRALRAERERSGGQFAYNKNTIRTLDDVLDSVRWAHEVLGSRFFLVDYLQLAWVGNSEKMFDRITEVSHEVRGIAKDMRVTTVGFSQLNRYASRSTERPTKESLMGGSPLENDADQVLILDHTRVEKQPSGDVRAFAILDKNRHGEEFDIPTLLEARTLGLREAQPDEEPTWPT